MSYGTLFDFSEDAMGLAREFKSFALKGNVVDLAVAVVIGGAFGKIVTALVGDLIMPVFAALLPGNGEWRNLTATALNLKVGDFAGAVVDFFIIAAVLFVIVVKAQGTLVGPAGREAVASTKNCPECLEPIPLGAKRCRACTAVQLV